MHKKLLLLSALAAGANAQGVCTLTAETNPAFSWSTCTAPGSCTVNAGKLTLDANWRWLHSTGGSTNCYTGNEWNATACATGAACATACCLDGADYSGTYGATVSGNSLGLKFVTTGSYSTNIGSRMYLMESETSYQMFKLLNKEFTFDVDVSKLPCGLNGAVYLVSMDADGGMSKYSSNKAGAKYGTGYCDSQCPRDLKFIDGTVSLAFTWCCLVLC
jgi:cellulose 1,4-beta-cellobiosidase